MTTYKGSVVEVDRRLPLFGWSVETISMLVLPMVYTRWVNHPLICLSYGRSYTEDCAPLCRVEALGSMGNDAPLACLSKYNPRLFDYFKQLFAQVTNPPIDPFREKVVMSLACPVGPEHNILEPSADQCRRLWLDQPILSRQDMRVIKATKHKGWKVSSPEILASQCLLSMHFLGFLQTKVLNSVYAVSEDLAGLVPALNRLCTEAAHAVEEGFTFIVISDKKAGNNFVPIRWAFQVRMNRIRETHVVSSVFQLSAGSRSCAPPPHPTEAPHEVCTDCREWRGPWGARYVLPSGIWCRCHVPVPGLRDLCCFEATGKIGSSVRGPWYLLQLCGSCCQRHLEGHGQDGHLDPPQLQGKSILRWPLCQSWIGCRCCLALFPYCEG